MTISQEEFLRQLGAHLRKLREEKGFSRLQCADLAGMSRSQLIRMENGEVNASIYTLKRLADALERPLIDLINF